MTFNYPRKIRLADITVRDGLQHERLYPPALKCGCWSKWYWPGSSGRSYQYG